MSAMTNVFRYVVTKPLFNLSPMQISMTRKSGVGRGGLPEDSQSPCRVGIKETADSWTQFVPCRRTRCSFLACLPVQLILPFASVHF